MKPVTQTILHTETTKGNCLRAAIASILEIDIDDIPLFEEMGADWAPALDDWLWEQYQLDLDFCDRALPPRGFSIAVGKSPRGIGHAVVALQGVPVWDPHPDRSGIVEIERYWYFYARPLSPLHESPLLTAGFKHPPSGAFDGIPNHEFVEGESLSPWQWTYEVSKGYLPMWSWTRWRFEWLPSDALMQEWIEKGEIG